MVPKNSGNNRSPGFTPVVLPDGNGGFVPCPEVLTEDELIQFLRIPEVSKAENYKNVVENLKRHQNLPCIHISHKCLYPRDAVLKWMQERIARNMN